jgi:hypothetical protein
VISTATQCVDTTVGIIIAAGQLAEKSRAPGLNCLPPPT